MTRVPYLGKLIVVLAVGASLSGGVSRAQVTIDGHSYRVIIDGGRVTADNTQSGGNEREAIWQSDGPSESTSTECAMWQSGEDSLKTDWRSESRESTAHGVRSCWSATPGSVTSRRSL